VIVAADPQREVALQKAQLSKIFRDDVVLRFLTVLGELVTNPFAKRLANEFIDVLLTLTGKFREHAGLKFNLGVHKYLKLPKILVGWPLRARTQFRWMVWDWFQRSVLGWMRRLSFFEKNQSFVLTAMIRSF